MTTTNYDTALLAACKHYMRITETKPESFIKEICELTEQYCKSLPDEIIQLTEKEQKH